MTQMLSEDRDEQHNNGHCCAKAELEVWISKLVYERTLALCPDRAEICIVGVHTAECPFIPGLVLGSLLRNRAVTVDRPPREQQEKQNTSKACHDLAPNRLRRGW